MNEQIFVEESENSLRLDQLLANRFKERYSRSYFQKLIQDQLVLVNGLPAKKRIKPQVNDEIEIEFTLDRKEGVEPENIPLSILYEDDDILVVNKPAGLVVHPAPGNWTGTFVNALVFHCQNLLRQESDIRPGIVHRLDKDTSGVLIAAKNSYSQAKLIESFSKREVIKLYLAITIGNPGNQEIRASIGRHPRMRQKMAIIESGRLAISHVETLATGKVLSLVRVKIETGRTHQIRVHLSSLGTPILGDTTYGNASINTKLGIDSQLLHAEILEIPHPRTREILRFQAPLPELFEKFKQQIK